MEFRDQVVFITGAAGYIGKAAAEKFKKEGAFLSLIDIDGERLEDVAAELNLDEDRALLLEADVRIEKHIIGAIRETLNSFQRIDVLFNNAGIEGNVKRISELSIEDLDQVYQTNIRGAFTVMKHILSVMEGQQKGSIINMGSAAGLAGMPGLSPFVMSKHAVMGMTKVAALEFADKNIRVNSLCPGFVQSRMMTSVERSIMPNAPQFAKQKFTEKIPMKRYGTSDEIADMVLFLASDRSKYITGAHFSVDGGLQA